MTEKQLNILRKIASASPIAPMPQPPGGWGAPGVSGTGGRSSAWQKKRKQLISQGYGTVRTPKPAAKRPITPSNQEDSLDAQLARINNDPTLTPGEKAAEAEAATDLWNQVHFR